MKIIANLCLISLMVQPAFAEPTPAGTPATYTNENGPFTYYYSNGEPVPPGARAFISPVGVAFILNPDGTTGESIFATRAEASAAANYKPDCSGAVFGAGPSGIPAGCPGSSNSLPSAAAVDDKAYDKASFELTTLLYSASEIGAKSCTPAGTKMPGSLAGWWSAVKTYSTGEVARDKKLNTSVEALQKKIQEMTSGTSTSKDVQSDGIQVQIEMVNASIESLNGEGGRIPLREKLLVAALASVDENGKENVKTMEAYKKMVNEAFVNSLNQAQAACERKKKVKTCVTDEKGDETCTEKEEKDPVPGCEVALAQIPAMKAGPAQGYGETYLTASMPSTALNNHMEGFEVQMTNIMASIPRSDDAAYDWSTPMEEGLKAMKLARKDSGTKCPGAADSSGKEKISKASTNFLSSLGISEDDPAKVGDTFGDVWTATDNVIGQAAYRGEYFTLVGKKINALLTMDRAKLKTLLTTKGKLEDYLKNLKNQLSLSPSSVASKTSTTTTASGGTTPKVAVAAQSTATTQAAVATVGGKVNFEASTQSQTTSSVSGLNANAKASASNMPSATAISGTSVGSANGWSGLSLGSASMAMAKKSLDSIAKNDKKLSTMVSTTTEGTSSGSGSSSGTSKAGSKTKAAGTLFTVVNNDSGADSIGGSIDKSFSALSAKPGVEEVYKSAAYGSSFGGDNSSGTGGRSSGSYSRISSSSTVGYSRPAAVAVKGSTSTSTTTVVKPGSVNPKGRTEATGEVSNDARLVSQSIVAKKFKKKDAYAAAENDSLFQRVTKAYIRNYEKVEEPSAASAEEQANP